MLIDRIGSVLAKDLDRASKAHAIAELICTQGGYRGAGLYDVDIQRGVVSNISWYGAGPPAYLTFPVTRGLTSRAIAERKTINVGDVTRDPDYLTALGTTRSEIIIPVLDATGDRVLGTIDAESDRPHAFNVEAEVELEKCAVAIRRLWSDPLTEPSR